MTAIRICAPTRRSSARIDCDSPRHEAKAVRNHGENKFVPHWQSGLTLARMSHVNRKLRHENNSVRHRQAGFTLADMCVPHRVFHPSWPGSTWPPQRGAMTTEKHVTLHAMRGIRDFKCASRARTATSGAVGNPGRGYPLPIFRQTKRTIPLRSTRRTSLPISEGSNGNSGSFVRGGRGAYADFRKTTINILRKRPNRVPDHVVQPFSGSAPDD